jgi:2-hydroxychromene-2-carboxylate isomerase
MSKTILFCGAVALAMAGCASEPHQVAELARAQTLVEQAEQGGAQQFAPADLQAARDKLQQAQQKHTDDEVTVRLAQEAALDAQVAAARTRSAKAEQALAQVNAGSETLRQEASRPQQQ